MKKLSVLSLILAVLMLVMMVPAAAVTVQVETTKTDVLKDAYIEFQSKNLVTSSGNAKLALINDEIIAKSDADAFLNLKTFSSAGTTLNDKATWDYTFAGRKYGYVIRFDLAKKSDIDGFSMWFSRDKKDYMVERQIDPEFDILVSKDNGQTWTVAWESARVKLVEGTAIGATVSSAIVSGACFPKSQGGNMEYVNSSATGYAKCSADFAATITGVTNVMYAASFVRSATSADCPTDAQGNRYLNVENNKYSNYSTRLAEIDVYGKESTAAPATGDNTVVLTVVAVVAMLGAAYVCKKKLFD